MPHPRARSSIWGGTRGSCSLPTAQGLSGQVEKLLEELDTLLLLLLLLLQQTNRNVTQCPGAVSTDAVVNESEVSRNSLNNFYFFLKCLKRK